MVGTVVFIVVLVAVFVGVTVIVYRKAEDEVWDFPPLIGLGAGVLAVLLILAVNFFMLPTKKNRFVPDTKITASLNGTDETALDDLVVGNPFYLQIKVSVESKSVTRRLFGDDEIPIVIEISNPFTANFTIQKSDRFKETKPPEKNADGTFYYLTVFADRVPKEALINLKGIAKEAGEQQVKVTFGKKVSDKYWEMNTLTYKKWRNRNR